MAEPLVMPLEYLFNCIGWSSHVRPPRRLLLTGDRDSLKAPRHDRIHRADETCLRLLDLSENVQSGFDMLGDESAQGGGYRLPPRRSHITLA